MEDNSKVKVSRVKTQTSTASIRTMLKVQGEQDTVLLRVDMVDTLEVVRDTEDTQLVDLHSKPLLHSKVDTTHKLVSRLLLRADSIRVVILRTNKDLRLRFHRHPLQEADFLPNPHWDKVA